MSEIKRVKTTKKTAQEPVAEVQAPVAEAPAVEAPVAPVPEGKVKMNTKAFDNAIRVLMTHFKLPEKEVKTVLQGHVPASSEFRKKRSKKANANGLKKPISAFLIYSTETRPEVAKTMTCPKEDVFKAIAKQISANWKALSPEVLQQYKARAEQAKIKYQEELAKRQASGASSAPVAPTSESESEAKPKKTRAKKTAVVA